MEGFATTARNYSYILHLTISTMIQFFTDSHKFLLRISGLLCNFTNQNISNTPQTQRTIENVRAKN